MNRPYLTIIGHTAYNEDITPHSAQVSTGGAAYYASVGAYLAGGQFAVVTNIGQDFDKNVYERLNADSRGINIVRELMTARFTITQHSDGHRLFKATWGAAEKVVFTTFAQFYRNSQFIHLATAPPAQQLLWIEFIRRTSPQSIISVDVFETFCRDSKAQSIQVISAADIIFLNEEELHILELDINSLSNKQVILKMGSKGALYKHGDEIVTANAPNVISVDTTGAGDVLAGAFLSLIGNRISLSTALNKAVTFATKSVTKFGVDHLLF